MNRSSMKEEEDEVGHERRTASFCLWHPCYFLEQALRAFLRCLGVDTAATRKGSILKKEEKSPWLKHASEVADHQDHTIITPENSASNSQKSYQEAADPPSTTSQININARAVERRGRGRPPLNQGSGSQHNSIPIKI